MPNPSEKVLIRGLVVPSEWDKNGQVVGVSIKTFDEDEYFITNRKETQKILKYLRQAVEIEAIVKIKNLKKFLDKCDLNADETGEKR